MSNDKALQQHCIDAVMTVLTPMISGDPVLMTQMWLEQYDDDPSVLLQGLMMVTGWLLGVLDEAGIDRHECLQAFAAEGAGRFAGF